jgi:hypothetical protein
MSEYCYNTYLATKFIVVVPTFIVVSIVVDIGLGVFTIGSTIASPIDYAINGNVSNTLDPLDNRCQYVIKNVTYVGLYLLN